MPKGRKTGGRTRGVPNRATVLRREVEAKARAEIASAIETDLTVNQPPAEVIKHMSSVEIMEYAMYLRAAAGDWDGAADRARDVAPYRQPRLSTQTLNVRNNDSQRSIEDLERERTNLAGRRAALDSGEAIGDRPRGVAEEVPDESGCVVH